MMPLILWHHLWRTREVLCRPDQPRVCLLSRLCIGPKGPVQPRVGQFFLTPDFDNRPVLA